MDVNQVIAHNLAYFLSRPGAPTVGALAKLADVAPQTIRNYMDTAKRPYTSKAGGGSPTLDKLERIASKLHTPLWTLLHPDLERALYLLEAGEAAERSLAAKPQPMQAPRRSEPVRIADPDASRAPVVSRRSA